MPLFRLRGYPTDDPTGLVGLTRRDSGWWIPASVVNRGKNCYTEVKNLLKEDGREII